jgi:hypothetical protein
MHCLCRPRCCAAASSLLPVTTAIARHVGCCKRSNKLTGPVVACTHVVMVQADADFRLHAVLQDHNSREEWVAADDELA